jgi:hypothetical protein
MPEENIDRAWTLDNTDASAKATATKRAKAILRKKNRNEYVAEFDVPGSVQWCAGRTVMLEGFGPKWSGKYRILEVVHRVADDGYKCHLKMQKCLKGY